MLSELKRVIRRVQNGVIEQKRLTGMVLAWSMHLLGNFKF